MRIFEQVPEDQVDGLKQDFVARITKILLSSDNTDLPVDEDLIYSMPANSNSPIFLAANLFMDVLLECGVQDDQA